MKPSFRAVAPSRMWSLLSRFQFLILVAGAAILGGRPVFAAADSANAPARREWTIEGVKREALVYVPAAATTEATPVIFAFHGHGGNMNATSRNMGYQRLWPEAIVVYPQGLKTPGRLTDPEGTKPGWQHGVGVMGDRDLKFFDAMLASLRHDYRVDERRIYSTGHSNGAGFTYWLWVARGDQFAAFAPSSAALDLERIPKLIPKPVLHVAGRNDPLVKFEWQQATIDALKKLNQVGPGQPWEENYTLYPSKIGAPVVTVIHPGTHQFLAAAPALIVKFFKANAKPDTPPKP